MNLSKIKEILNKFNGEGIPLPLVRDPKTGMGSVSVTMVFLSSIYVQIALLNSLAKIFQGVDVMNALYWNGMCLAFYIGRKFNVPGKSAPDEDK